jgi:hypothetical protein
VGPAGKDGAGAASSGSRLKVRYRLGEDGSREPIPGGWWDSQLQVECSFQLSSDGIDRCLPLAMMIISGATAPHYSDATCTHQVLEYFPPVAGCAVGFSQSYAAKADDTCSTAVHVYTIGAALDASAEVFSLVGGVCKSFGMLGPGIGAQPTLDEIPAASFVGATGIHD